jgi:4-amino-4-deoxy-L-arabinose transferase-like glycosyltransferase
VRFAYWALITPHWRPDADADQYLRISRTIADGDGFSLVYPQLELHPTAFRPPLYPYLLSAGSWLFGDAIWHARLLNLVLGSLVAVLAGVLAARIGGRTAGLVAGGAVALYPPLLANDTVTLTEPLGLLLGAILLADEGRWLAAGVAAGLLLLTRPNGYVVVAILALWTWWKLDLRRAVALGLVSLAVLAPWLVRNQVQLGTWRPTTSDGLTLAAIYGAPGREAGHFVDPVLSPAYDDARYRLAQFDEAEWNEMLTQEGLSGARDNPDYVWYMVQRNAEGMFEVSPKFNRYPERVDGRNWDFREATRPLFYVVAVLGLAGLAVRLRDRRVQVLVAITAQYIALSLLLVGPPRLRAPFDVATCIGLGLLVAWALDRRRRAAAGAGDGDGAERVPEPVGSAPTAG